MGKLREHINDVVPFLGAGVSMPFGYYSWRKLLEELLKRCDDIQKGNMASKKSEITKHITNGEYIDAANEMDNIFQNLGATVSHIIERVADVKHIITKKDAGLLGEYLHLFPQGKYLTTNYDRVVEDVINLQDDRYAESVVAVINPEDPNRRTIVPLRTPERTAAKVFHLHGIYTLPTSIILSKAQYDDYYGTDIKSSMRRLLPTVLRKLHNNYVVLYIGCSMTVSEDRVLQLLRDFYGNLRDYPFSYALLNVNDIVNEEDKEIPYKAWKTLDVKKQKELNTKLDQKENELEDMNVRVIWYSATKGDEHESAKHELFEYILAETREKQDEDRQKREEDRIIKDKENIERKEKIEQQLWQHVSDKAIANDSNSITTKEDVKEIVLSEEQLKQIEEFFKDKIFMKEGSPTKVVITFPMYKIGGGLYEISLKPLEDGKFYLSDEGATYAELDKIFELKEPDVIKNLVAILKQYNCRRQQGTNAFVIDCTYHDIDIKLSYLIQAISFMLNMKIFYV